MTSCDPYSNSLASPSRPSTVQRKNTFRYMQPAAHHLPQGVDGKANDKKNNEKNNVPHANSRLRAMVHWNAKVFSRIELQSAYLQFPLEESSLKITLSLILQRNFSNIMSNLLTYLQLDAIFQSFISHVLSSHPKTICYMNNVFVPTMTHDEHLDVLDNELTDLIGAGVNGRDQRHMLKITHRP